MEINQIDQKMLKPFDDMLRCRLCSDFFNHCVMTACSHNFCTACLKKRMETESDCPMCYEDIQENELRSNRSMDKIVRIYKKLMKANPVQPSQLQPSNTNQSISFNLTTSVAQAVSPAQNRLPVQTSSSKTFPVTKSPLIHSIQLQSSTSLATSSAGTVSVECTPVIQSFQSEPQSSSSFTNSSTETIPAQSAPLHLPQVYPVKEEGMEYDNSEMQDLILVSTTEETNYSDDFQTKVWRLLEENRKELESIKQLIAGKDSEIETTFVIDNAELPCKSSQELTQFNSALKNEEYFIRVYKYLRTIGGKNAKEAVRKCLCRIMKNSVALLYNWKGMRGEKAAFSKLENIVALIFKTTSYHYRTITRSSVNTSIKEWLMRAGDREGGRKKRLMESFLKDFVECSNKSNRLDTTHNETCN